VTVVGQLKALLADGRALLHDETRRLLKRLIDRRFIEDGTESWILPIHQVSNPASPFYPAQWPHHKAFRPQGDASNSVLYIQEGAVTLLMRSQQRGGRANAGAR
jgi:hypothetical protein